VIILIIITTTVTATAQQQAQRSATAELHVSCEVVAPVVWRGNATVSPSQTTLAPVSAGRGISSIPFTVTTIVGKDRKLINISVPEKIYLAGEPGKTLRVTVDTGMSEGTSPLVEEVID